MANTAATAPAPGTGSKWSGLYNPRRVLTDTGYVIPGFFISLLAFSLLVPLASLSIATLVIWLGAVLLPATLLLATKFADLSRSRSTWWGAPVIRPAYREIAPGIGGFMRVMADGRRWLDLIFETLVAFPIRALTFSVGITWLSAALGGTTSFIWARFLPENDSVFPGNMLVALSSGAISPEFAYSRSGEALTYTVFGLFALATLPLVMRALAVLDITVTRAGLGAPGPASPAQGGAGATAPDGSAPGATPGIAPAAAFAARAGWSWILVGFAAVAALAVTWPLLSTFYGVHPAISMVFAAAQAATLVLALRLPAAAIALGAITPAVAALVTAAPTDTPWPWPVTMLVVQALLAFIIGLRYDWRWVLAALALPQLAVIGAVVLSGAGFTSGAITSLVISSSVALGLGLAGIVSQALFEDRGALRKEREHSAALDAKQRELSERNLVARELHDVVAHSMSVVSIQANTAKYRIPGLGDEAEAEFEAIAQSSRQALSEMRGLLATLRDSDGTAPLAPQPTLADLPALIDSSRNSGAQISFSAEGDAPAESVLSATGLTVYRVVQESLANAMRHAPGAAIDVTVTLGDDTITVNVVNGPAPQEAPPAPGSGLGLAGLRERVTALGGSVSAGPTPAAAGEGSGSAGTGFAVSVELPR